MKHLLRTIWREQILNEIDLASQNGEIRELRSFLSKHWGDGIH